jgi:hypothetical protein
MPLTQRVNFKTPLRKQNRLRVPKVVRSQFKLETSEVTKVTVSVAGTISVKESFLGKIRNDGYITAPAVVVALLKGDKSSLEGYVLEVTLEPA